MKNSTVTVTSPGYLKKLYSVYVCLNKYLISVCVMQNMDKYGYIVKINVVFTSPTPLGATEKLTHISGSVRQCSSCVTHPLNPDI